MRGARNLLLAVLIGLAGAFASCSGDDANATLLEQLEQKGFFEFCSGADCSSVRREIADNGWPGIFSETGRYFPADSESLTESGVGRFVESVRPFLEKQGVTIPEITERFDEEYALVVDGEVVPVWTREEIDRELHGNQGGLTWGLSTARTVGLVNSWLAATSSKQRAYAVNGGNDLWIMFLSDDLFQFISTHPGVSPESAPYSPTEDYPWFGQPH